MMTRRLGNMPKIGRSSSIWTPIRFGIALLKDCFTAKDTGSAFYSPVSLFYYEPPFSIAAPFDLPVCYVQDEDLECFLGRIKRTAEYQNRPALRKAILSLGKAYFQESKKQLDLRKPKEKRVDIEPAIEWVVQYQVGGKVNQRGFQAELALANRNTGPDEVECIRPTIERSIYRNLRYLEIPRR